MGLPRGSVRSPLSPLYHLRVSTAFSLYQANSYIKIELER